MPQAYSLLVECCRILYFLHDDCIKTLPKSYKPTPYFQSKFEDIAIGRCAMVFFIASRKAFNS